MRFAKLCLCALLAITMSACSLNPKVGRKGGMPQIIAHRGASAFAPENTIAAFNLAADQKADWFELDCLLTADGEVVVCHDGDTSRTGDRALVIGETSLAKLKEVDIGSWKGKEFSGERIPTLGEALTVGLQREIGVYIEIKSIADDAKLESALLRQFNMSNEPAETVMFSGQLEGMIPLIDAAGTANAKLARAVVAEVRQYAMERKVVIQSFSPIICAVVRHAAPELRVELLVGHEPERPEVWTNAMAWQRLTGVQGMNLAAEAVSAERMQELHGRQLTVAVWTVDDVAEAQRLNEMKVDGLITNRPAEIRKALE